MFAELIGLILVIIMVVLGVCAKKSALVSPTISTPMYASVESVQSNITPPTDLKSILIEPREQKNKTHISFDDVVHQRTFDKKTRKIISRDKKIRINSHADDVNTFSPLT